MLELALGMSRSSPKELSRGRTWRVGRKKGTAREWYGVQYNWSIRRVWGNAGVEGGGRVKVAKSLGCQAKELGLYSAGDREPFLGCKLGCDLVNHDNDPGVLEVSSEEVRLLETGGKEAEIRPKDKNEHSRPHRSSASEQTLPLLCEGPRTSVVTLS